MSNAEQHRNLSKDMVYGHVSDQYAPVNTGLFVKPFIDRGWFIDKTKTNSNREGKVHKEIIVLKHNDYTTEHGPIELKVVNSYDASSSLRIYAGIHRLVCSNGLVMMVEGEQFRFIHRGNAIYEKLDNAYDKIVAYFDTVKERVEKLSNFTMSQDNLHTVIDNIAKAVFEKDTKTSTTKVINISSSTKRNLTRVRRQADNGIDAFTVLNIVQENITRRGNLSAMVTITNKETNETETKYVSKNRTENRSIMSDIKLNQIITGEFLKMVG